MYTSSGPSSGVGQLLIRCQFWRGPYHVSLPRAHHVPLLYNKIRLTERPAILRFSRRQYRCGAALARYAQMSSRALAVGSGRTWDEVRLEWHRPCRGHRAGPVRPVLLLQREDRRTVPCSSRNATMCASTPSSRSSTGEVAIVANSAAISSTNCSWRSRNKSMQSSPLWA